jgi:lactam utilization protein B
MIAGSTAVQELATASNVFPDRRYEPDCTSTVTVALRPAVAPSNLHDPHGERPAPIRSMRR